MGLRLRDGDASELRDEKFDLIILSHVVEHILDVEAFMAEIVTHLNPGGHIYIEVPDITDFCMGAFQTAHVYYFTIAHMNALCASAGLKVTVTKNIGPFFYGVYRFDLETPIHVPPPDEYATLRKIIWKHDLRESAKSLLKGAGLFTLCRAVVNLFR
jgi:SAM-dependent methyltransferase